MPEQTDIYISDIPDAESITNADKVTGIQGNVNKNFTFSSILAWFVNAVKSAFVPIGRTVNNKSLATDITLTASDVGARPDTWAPTAEGIGAIPATEKGEPLGVPELDSSGKVPASQLPPTASTAADISYDNTVSGLIAEDVQDALDEVADDIDGKQSTITASGILKGNGSGGVTAATPGTDYGTYSKPSGGIPASDIASGVIPVASTANPQMDGAASPGSTGVWADGGHVHPSDTTKANQAQLATVESGSTASRAYAAGEYFCWNGLLYRATAAISVGGSFTPGTNCTQTTATSMEPPRIVGGDLNDYTIPGLYMWTDAVASMPSNTPIVAQSVMIVLQASQAGRVCQIVFAHNATRNGAYYRWLFSNAWTSWYTIG